MWCICRLTFLGLIRDRVLHGILGVAVLFLLIPSISTLSMRQVTALSVTLSTSLVSFILLLIATFVGGTMLWKDFDRRYIVSLGSFPIRRSFYVWGKFFGILLFMVLVSLLLGLCVCAVVWFVAGAYPPDRPVSWVSLFLCLGMDCLKYVFLVSFALLFSTVSTSFFLPVFGTISIYWLGTASQEAFDYVQGRGGETLPELLKLAVKYLYYIVPNFSAFDFKVQAIYGLSVSLESVGIVFGYFLVFTSLVLSIATVIYSKRELQ